MSINVINLRDEILSADDLPRKKLFIPEWKTTVFVRMLTGRERDLFESANARQPGVDVRGRFAVAVLSDEEGNQLFTEADIPAISAKSSKALDRIFAVGIKHNGLSKDDLEELKKV